MDKNRLVFHWLVGAVLAATWWPQTEVGYFCMGFYFGMCSVYTFVLLREGK